MSGVGGNRSKRPKQRSPLSENGEAANNDNIGNEDKIINLQSLNQVLVKEIKSLREANGALLKKEKESHDGDETKLKEEMAVLISEKNILEASILQMREQMQKEVDARSTEVVKQVEDRLKKEFEKEIVHVEEQVREESQREFQEWVLEKEKKWQVALSEEIAKKEEEYQAMILEKNSLQMKISQLKQETEVMSKESEGAEISAEAEKKELLSQILAARADIEEMRSSGEILQEKITKKEEECQTVIQEKNNLEEKIKDMIEQMETMSKLSDAAKMSSKAENDELLSQAFAAQKDMEGIRRSYEILKENITKKEEERQAAISDKNSMVAEVTKKEEEWKALMSEKINLEANIKQLNEELQAVSKESEDARISLKAEKDNLLSQVLAARKDVENMGRSNEVLQEKMARKEEECQRMISEKNNLEAEILQFKEQIHVMSKELDAARKCSETEKVKLLSQVLAAKNDIEEMGRSYEIVKEEIATKEEECQAVILEKIDLEAKILQLNKQLQIMSKESETAQTSLEAEKNKLLSQVLSERKKSEEMAKNFEILQEQITRKEGDYQTMILEKRKLDDKNFQLKEQMEIMSKESEAAQMCLESEKDKLLSLLLTARKDIEEMGKSYEILKEEITKKEEELQEVISEKNGLAENILQLNEQMEVMLKVSEAAHISVKAEKDELLSQVLAVKKDIEEMGRSHGILQEQLTKTEEECQITISEKCNLEAYILQLEERVHVISKQSEEAQMSFKGEKEKLLSQILEARKDAKELGRSYELLQRKLGMKEEEYQEVISERSNLEAETVQLKEQMQAMCKELEATRISLEAEKDKLSSQVLVARKDIEEMGRSYEILQEKFLKKEEECQVAISGKNCLESKCLQLKEEMWTMSKESEAVQMSLEAEKDGLLTQVLAARKEIEEMSKSNEMSQKAWDAAKENLLSDLSKSEEKAADISKQNETILWQLNQKYKELCIENEFLKSQLNEYNATLVSVEDEKQALLIMLSRKAERLESILAENRTLKEEADYLRQEVTECRKQCSNLNQEYQTIKDSLKRQTDMLQKDIDSRESLLEEQVGKVEELTVKNNGLKKKIQELSVSLEEMQERHAKVVKENGLLREEFESLRTEFTKELQSIGRLSELEGQVSELHAKLASARSAYGGVSDELNKVKEDMNKQIIDICHTKEEKEALNGTLKVQISKIKALEEELFSAKSSLSDLQNQISKLAEVNKFQVEKIISLQAEVTKLSMTSERQDNENNIIKLESTFDNVESDIGGRGVKADQLIAGNQVLQAAEDNKQKKMHRALSAWVVSAGAAVAGVAIAAYLKLTKEL